MSAAPPVWHPRGPLHVGRMRPSGDAQGAVARPPSRRGTREPPPPHLTTALRSTLARICSTLPSITRGNTEESAPLQNR